MKATICMLIALCYVAMNGYPQNAQKPVRATSLFELNTTMVAFGAPSTRLVLGWQADVNTLFQDGMDGVEGYFDLRHPGQELLRSGALALFTGVSLIVNRAFSLTAHDENHMEAAQAIGASSVGLVRADTFQSLSLGEFFLESFDFTSEPGLYSYVKPNATLEELAYVAGEGLDTNQLIANAVSTGMIEVGGHIMDLAPYLLNKLWGIPYFLETGPYSDAANYMSLLQQQGYGTPGTNSVIFLSAASCLLSGGFLGLMQGTLNFIENGDTAVKPLKLKIGEASLFWPEMTTWLNPKNVSLQVSMNAAWRDFLFLQAGVDAAVLGDTNVTPEITLGTKVRIDWIILGIEITSNFAGLPFFLGSIELSPWRFFSIGVRGFYGTGNTNRELREYPLGSGVIGFLRARL